MARNIISQHHNHTERERQSRFYKPVKPMQEPSCKLQTQLPHKQQKQISEVQTQVVCYHHLPWEVNELVGCFQ